MGKLRKKHTVFTEGIQYKIIEKTIEIVARDGEINLTIHELAKECGFVTTTLYTYFSSKKEIIAEAYKEMEKRFEKIVFMPVPEKIPEEMKVRMIAVYILSFVSENKWATRFIDPFSGFEVTKKLVVRLTKLLSRFSNDEEKNEYRVYRFLAGVLFKIRYRFNRGELPVESDIDDLCRFMSYPEN